MGSKTAGDLSARLEGVRRRFERWRRTRRVRSRVPESLWAAAVKMARMCGVHRTARALRVDYYSLRKRVEQEVAEADACRKREPWLRLSSWPVPRGLVLANALWSWRTPGGAKMRVHLKGVEAPDLAALSRSFWDLGS